MTSDPSYEHKERIRDVLALLSRGMDRVDPELIASCYWPEGIDDHGSFTGTGREFADKPERQSPGNVAAHHLLGQSLIMLTGHQASSETYFSYTAIVRAEPDREMWVEVHGRYLDVLEYRDGTWKILRRRVIHDLSRQQPAGAAFSDSASYPSGIRYPGDLSYQLPAFNADGDSRHLLAAPITRTNATGNAFQARLTWMLTPHLTWGGCPAT